MLTKSGKIHTDEQPGQPHNESNEKEQPIGKSLTSEEDKKQKLDQERTILLSRLAEINIEDTRTKVAFILNLYRATRDSDIALALKYWKVFHPDLVGSNSISFDDFYKLPKFTSISRARAKIQNEFGLFQASGEVKKRRRDLDSEQRKSQVEEKPEDSLISIFCDESGKTGRYKIVGSLWINDGHRLYEVWKDLTSWKNDNGVQKEFHFSELKASEKHLVIEFLDRALRQADALGFKAIIVDSHPVRARSMEEINFSLHYQLLVKGIEHEIRSGRFVLPRNISVTKDKDDGVDKLRLVELEQKLRADCQNYFNQEIIVEEVKAEESHSSVFIQLADLFAGSINRQLNKSGANYNYKDELAVHTLNLLGIESMQATKDSPQDFATILWL